MMRYDLSPMSNRLRSLASQIMRLSDDLRRCVVFIGTEDNNEVSGIKCSKQHFLIQI